jgi:hypothetical protein
LSQKTQGIENMPICSQAIAEDIITGELIWFQEAQQMKEVLVSGLDWGGGKQQEAVCIVAEKACRPMRPGFGVAKTARLIENHKVQSRLDLFPSFLQATPAEGLERKNASQWRLVAILLKAPQELERTVGIQDVKLEVKPVPHLLPPLDH